MRALPGKLFRGTRLLESRQDGRGFGPSALRKPVRRAGHMPADHVPSARSTQPCPRLGRTGSVLLRRPARLHPAARYSVILRIRGVRIPAGGRRGTGGRRGARAVARSTGAGSPGGASPAPEKLEAAKPEPGAREAEGRKPEAAVREARAPRPGSRGPGSQGPDAGSRHTGGAAEGRRRRLPSPLPAVSGGAHLSGTPARQRRRYSERNRTAGRSTQSATYRRKPPAVPPSQTR